METEAAMVLATKEVATKAVWAPGASGKVATAAAGEVVAMVVLKVDARVVVAKEAVVMEKVEGARRVADMKELGVLMAAAAPVVGV